LSKCAILFCFVDLVDLSYLVWSAKIIEFVGPTNGFKFEARSHGHQKIRISGCGYQDVRTLGLVIFF